MNEQLQPDLQSNLDVNIQRQEALTQFERWVNESNQADIAYATGTLDEWLKTKLERELVEFQKGQQQNGSEQ